MPPSRLRFALERISPPYFVLLLFGTVLVALLFLFHKRANFHHGSVILASLMMLAFALASLIGQRRRLRDGGPGVALRESRQLLVDWLPFVICLSVYENLHDLTQLIRPDTVDRALHEIDLRLLGVEPTLWLQPLVRPWLTNYLSLCYTSYFVIPPLLAGWLYVRGHVERFKELQLMLLIAFYGGFLGYLAVPAIGPRYVLAAHFTVPLTGFYYQLADGAMNQLEAVSRDCFPSLHTAVSTLWLLYAIRHRALLPARRVVLPLLLVVTVSLWFSTVYLRYHWTIDVLAGFVHAALTFVLARWLHRRWPRRERVRTPIDRAAEAA